MLYILHVMLKNYYINYINCYSKLPGHQTFLQAPKCFANFQVLIRVVYFYYFSCRGLDFICYECTWRGHRRRYHRQIQRLWRNKESALEFRQKNRLSQGLSILSFSDLFLDTEIFVSYNLIVWRLINYSWSYFSRLFWKVYVLFDS